MGMGVGLRMFWDMCLLCYSAQVVKHSSQCKYIALLVTTLSRRVLLLPT